MDIPVGMKNPTSGDFSVMLNSVVAAQSSHSFIYRGMDVTTEGNDLAHVILRGGVDKYGTCIPNYHYEDLIRLLDMYRQRELKIRRRSLTQTIQIQINSLKNKSELSVKCFTAEIITVN